MLAEKIETLVIFMDGKKKMQTPGAQAVPFSPSGADWQCNTILALLNTKKYNI